MSRAHDVLLERGLFHLETQFHSPEDLRIFWETFGPARKGPDIERRDPWWFDLPF